MKAQAYPELRLSVQWTNPKAMAAARAALPRHVVARAVRHALKQGVMALPAKSRPVAAEIAVRMVASEEGRALNRQYRSKDYATNVLTFDYALAPILLADVVLCVPVLEREAAEQNKDLQAHGLHLLVHGTLHAMGYDHEHSQQAAQEMEALESQILQGLGVGNPYEA